MDELEVIQKVCKHCGKTIKGFSEHQVNWNMKLHELNCFKNPSNKTKQEEVTNENNGEGTGGNGEKIESAQQEGVEE